LNTKKTKKSPVAAACSALGTALLILLIVICLPLTVPKAFHYHVYTVISGSMEPAIPTGSLVYIKEMEPKDVQVDDVIAFYGTKDAASIITHRVVENRVLMGEFITKGDANATKDMNPAPYDKGCLFDSKSRRDCTCADWSLWENSGRRSNFRSSDSAWNCLCDKLEAGKR